MKTVIAKHVPLLLGLLFLVSGIYKLAHPGTATYALISLDVPRWLAVEVVTTVTGLELYLAFILVGKLDLRFGLALSTALVLAFTAFLWYLSTLAHPPACGCLGLTGMFKSARHEALLGLVRNCLILWGLRASYDYYCGPAPNQATRPRLA